MRIVFMGTTAFSCVVLNQLMEDGYQVVGVVTQPDRPFGRKRVLKAPEVKVMALEHGIPVLQPQRIKDEADSVLALNPDCIITCAYGQIVPKKILDAPRFRCLNVHASILPKFRGGAPIHKAIINGESETGVTLMHMDVGMDSGDMLAVRRVDIDEDDTFGDVEAKLMAASKSLIHDEIPCYFSGELTAVPQDEKAVTYAYAIKREEEFVSFDQPAAVVYNHIRGLIPWPVATVVLDDINIKVHAAAKIIKVHQDIPGTIIAIDEMGIHVAAQGGVIILESIQPAGKARMSALDVMNGFRNQWKGKRFK